MISIKKLVPRKVGDTYSMVIFFFHSGRQALPSKKAILFCAVVKGKFLSCSGLETSLHYDHYGVKSGNYENE